MKSRARETATNFSFNYIVVGAGSAGCILANRLSTDPRNRVLLLEAGRRDNSLVIQMPAAAYLAVITNPKWDWRYTTEPDPTRNNRVDIWPRGKVLGGTSSINGMLYVRGQREDYKHWALLGNESWDYSNVLSYFKRGEWNENGASEYHGGDGPLRVSNLRSVHPLSNEFLQAAVTAGLRHNTDFNGASQEGVGFLQSTQYRGRRYSSAKAYLRPARRRTNLNIVTKAHVTRLLFDGKRATGVEYLHAGKLHKVLADREIIVSAGAIGSPQILMLSGVGPADHLATVGIEVVHDLPGVGENLQEHVGLCHTYYVDQTTYNTEVSLAKIFIHGLNWLLFGRGPGSTPDAHVLAFIRTRPELASPDVQFHFTPAGYDLTVNGPILLARPAVTAITNICRPEARGVIRLKNADPFSQPAIHPNLLGSHEDLETLIAGAKVCKRIFETEPMASHVLEEFKPGPSVRTDADWQAYARENAVGIYHPAGTCKMGNDTMAVVDDRLKVRGIEGLRVADASIMPVIVSGNLNAPCMMIGEKASDLILKP